MYDELVEALRLCVKYGKAQDALENAERAADAIEELSAIREEQKAQIIAMAAEDKPRWIPVTERLPEEHGWYLCAVKSFFGKGSFVDACKYDGHYFVQDGLATERVTHWMPLPEPPKEEAT